MKVLTESPAGFGVPNALLMVVHSDSIVIYQRLIRDRVQKNPRWQFLVHVRALTDRKYVVGRARSLWKGDMDNANVKYVVPDPRT